MCNLKRNQKEGVKYSCHQCNYQATQQVSLKTHKKSVHGGVKYSCSQYDYYHQCDNFNFSLTLHSKILTLSLSGFLKNRKDGGGQICPPWLYGYRRVFSIFFSNMDLVLDVKDQTPKEQPSTFKIQALRTV